MEHPIQGLMHTAMSNIREMVDVNTIIGDPVEAPDGTVILPVSKVGFGFAAGGSEYNADGSGGGNASSGNGNNSGANGAHPFGGGSGGGVSIVPVGFLIVNGGNVRLLSTDNQNQIYDRLIDMAPVVVERIQAMFKKQQHDGQSHQHSNHQNSSHQSGSMPPS